MYYLQLDIRPTGGLTFRRMPGSILHISTYPFLPPSTMSGYLRRLLMLTKGIYPATAIKNAPYYVLPRPPYYVLGAYPVPREAYRVHTTHRQGVRAFTYTAFSRLSWYPTGKEVYQLHTWEYLFVERLRGYVVSEEPGPLERLKSVTNLGCKLGKEGYAYVEGISEPRALERRKMRAMPSVLIPATELVGIPSTVYTLYRHKHEGQIALDRLAEPVPNPIAGFMPFRAGWPAEPVEIDYWTDGEVLIPASLLEVL